MSLSLEGLHARLALGWFLEPYIFSPSLSDKNGSLFQQFVQPIQLCWIPAFLLGIWIFKSAEQTGPRWPAPTKKTKKQTPGH